MQEVKKISDATTSEFDREKLAVVNKLEETAVESEAVQSFPWVCPWHAARYRIPTTNLVNYANRIDWNSMGERSARRRGTTFLLGRIIGAPLTSRNETRGNEIGKDEFIRNSVACGLIFSNSVLWCALRTKMLHFFPAKRMPWQWVLWWRTSVCSLCLRSVLQPTCVCTPAELWLRYQLFYVDGSISINSVRLEVE